jgi:hypothetical protein
MKLDIKSIINQRVQQLNTRIMELSSILDNDGDLQTIEFVCDNFINETGKKIQDAHFSTLFPNISGVNSPVIYIFELVEPSIKPELIKRILNFRSKDNKDEEGNDLRRATAKVQKDIGVNPSRFLYVGSVKSNFESRIKQHIGLGHKHTYALHLKFWSQPGWCYRLHYIPIDNQSVTIDLEAAIAEYLQPLMGKREV